VEVPSRYKTYSFAELEKIAFTIEQKKVVKESYVSKEYVKKKPKELKENQYYYEAGYYSNLNEAVARHASGLSVSKIQEALNKKGYNLEVNNIMNDETKAALMDLQKKNGLPEGNLNMKTLRFLGLTL
jgi:N-acetyl-anhydromuramyl-L-alanine amidase AmpD